MPWRACRLLGLSAVTAGCTVADPPGRTATDPAGEPRLPVPEGSATAGSPLASAPVAAREDEPGSGAKIASIAMRTWIYDAPAPRSQKLGYLRAGAVVDRAERSAGTDGCEGGWYRVAPRGYVCVGLGASLDLEHATVRTAVRGPRRGEPSPYRYVLSRSPGPHYYFKLPSAEDQRRVEGSTLDRDAAMALSLFDDEPVDEVPPFLAGGGTLEKPYGAEKRLHYSVHAGRASEHSAFGLISVFDWTGRRFGLTTELDLLPLDRTKAARLTEVRGVALTGGGRPAFVVASGTPIYEEREGAFIRTGVAPGRSAWELTGKNNGSERGLLETREGIYLAYEGLKLARLREDRAGFAESGKKWISVSIKDQVLVAYEGKTPVYAALVSTGRGGMSDPEETHATVRGSFMIHAKHVSATMDGDEASDEAFELHDVPYVQYFHEGYALHGAYWHDEFGKTRSHGCVNLPPVDAAWLFDWTEPVVPPEWHGAINLKAGTLVYVHP